jgi:tetratricopeptide (TPR) repeat protein
MKGGNAITSAPALVGLIVFVALAGFAVWGLTRPKFQLASLGLIWVGLFLLPVSNLMPMMQYMAERFLYLPLVGWLISLGAVLWLSPRWRFTSALYGIAILVWMGLAWDRSLIWRDEITLFVQSSQSGPKTRRVEENAVAAVFDLPQMKRVFMRAPGATNQYVLANNASSDHGTWTAAIDTLLKTHQLFPEDENVLNALGIAYAKTGNREQAIHFFKLTAERRPAKATYWANLGQACLEAKRLDEARQAVEKAVDLEPKNLSALHTLAAVLWQQNDFASALKVFEKLHELEPNNAENKFWIEKAKEKLK